jgi:hypothetical protein
MLVHGVPQVNFSLLHIGHHGFGHFFIRRPFLPIGLKILQAVRQQQRKLTNKTPLTLSEASSAIQYPFIMD